MIGDCMLIILILTIGVGTGYMWSRLIKSDIKGESFFSSFNLGVVAGMVLEKNIKLKTDDRNTS
jgi:uncharacterized membrane protein